MAPFTIVAAFEMQDNKGAVVTYDTSHIGGMYTMGNNDFALTYTQYSASANGAAIVGSESDYDASQIALGWFHNFSKNTVVKTVYSKIDNNKQGTYFGRMGVASSLASPAAGSDPSSFQVSIQTSF